MYGQIQESCFTLSDTTMLNAMSEVKESTFCRGYEDDENSVEPSGLFLFKIRAEASARKRYVGAVLSYDLSKSVALGLMFNDLESLIDWQ